MQRLQGPSILAVFAFLILALWSVRSPVRSFEQPTAAAPMDQPSGKGPRFLGVVSCAAGACHAGNGPLGAWRCEYTTWAADDPHANAFTALRNSTSLRIQENLNRQNSKAKPIAATENRLCLKCHAPAGISEAEPERLVREGVGCESCHGPAEKWQEPHYQASWRNLKREDKEELGFRPIKDLKIRAQICADCHIGNADQEVNHDLIAAGHPRLRFELSAYLANMPRHWQTKTDFAQAWLMGQLVSAQAALHLLESRAKDKAKPWPEFAELDCYACHHNLNQPSWRQTRAYLKGVPGLPGLADWYYIMLPLLGEPSVQGAALTNESLLELQASVRRFADNRSQVEREARACAAGVRRLIEKWQTAKLDEPALVRLLPHLTGESSPALNANWDQAVQDYLALSAIYETLGTANSRYRNNPALRALQKACAEREAFTNPALYEPKAFNNLLLKLRTQKP